MNRYFIVHPLSPRSDLGREYNNSFATYREYLEDIFSDRRMHNIAITGSLGSGKSSLIQSFDSSRNTRTKFLYISLAEFTSINQVDSISSLSQSKVENTMIRQILSRCKNKDLPESRFIGIPEHVHMRWLKALGISLLTLASFVLIFHSQFGSLAGMLGVCDSLRHNVHMGLYGFVGSGLSLCTFLVLNRMLPRIKGFSFKLKSTVGEAEVQMQESSLTLDNHMFDIVYSLFRIRRKIDYTVVIEDMERLDTKITISIMHQLRELNNLVNNYIQSHCWHFPFVASKQLRFVYAISENILSAENRTKFFDVILPVVPTLNPVNAEKMLEDILRPTGTLSLKLSEFFHSPSTGTRTKVVVQLLSPLLVDYRTALTVRNELRLFRDLYKQRHGDNSLTDEDAAILLSILGYKALFPALFEQAISSNGSGLLHKISESELQKYYPNESREHCNKIIININKLFEKGFLGPNCLLMAGVNEQDLVSIWLNALSKAIHDNKYCSFIEVQNLTNALGSYKESSELRNLLDDVTNCIEVNMRELITQDSIELAAKQFHCLLAFAVDNRSWCRIFEYSIDDPSIQAGRFTTIFSYLSNFELCKTNRGFIEKINSQPLDWWSNHLTNDPLKEFDFWDPKMVDTLVSFLKKHKKEIIERDDLLIKKIKGKAIRDYLIPTKKT